jgi:histone H3/H4
MSRKSKKKKAAEPAKPKRRSSRVRGGAFANAKVEALIREAGAFRVSAGAVKALNDLLGERGMEIAKYAVEIARNSNRRTIKETDVILSAGR